MIITMSLLLSLATTGSLIEEVAADDAVLYDVIRDARSSNEARLHSGTMEFSLRFVRTAGQKALEATGDITWDETNTLWAYRVSDPEGLVSPTKTSDRPASDQPKRYMLRTPQKFYAYNPDLQTVYLDSRDQFAIDLFEVAPLKFYTMFHGQYVDPARPWAEMIGPHPAFKESRYELTREGSDRIRQVRTDADGGKLTLLMSLAACGNGLEARYDAAGDYPTMVQRFSWKKTPAGVCVLDECEFTASMRGKPTVNDTSYRLKVDRIDLKAVDASTFSQESLFAMLPRGFTFVDMVTKRSTKNAVKQTLSDQDLKGLTDKLRSSGFLGR